jgi:Leucine-rich repeat (LRR) protein
VVKAKVTMSTVFISYRRTNTAGEAIALFKDLAALLGENSAFMDVQSIALGRDFREVLQEVTASCDLMLVLIGLNWADAKDERGRKGLEDPDDYVRLELEAALKRDIPITPVLVQAARMPGPEQLPVEIRDLAYRNGFELSHARWESDVREMIRRLGLSVPPSEIPSGDSRPGESLKSNFLRRRMIALIGMIIFGLGFIGSAAVYFWPRSTALEDGSALARLAELGWTIKPGENSIRFEIASRALPPMEQSANLFRQIKQPFDLVLQSVPSLDGLHYLSNVDSCTQIAISAGEFTDISELHDFTHVSGLFISQVALNGLGTVDPSPLSSLTNLQKLGLHSTRIRSVNALSGLTKLRTLNLGETLVSDLSPISGLVAIEDLDVRGTRIEDLRPLSGAQHLVQIQVGAEQIPSLVNLKHLTKLVIIVQQPVDLAAVGELDGLESVHIFGYPFFKIASLGKFGKLRELIINGASLPGNLSMLMNIDVIGHIIELRKLSLGYLRVEDLEFVRNLQHLEDTGIGHLPVQSIEPLRGLKSLKQVSLTDIPVADISPLLDLPNLTELTIGHVPAREDSLVELERRGVKVTRL